MVDLEQRHRDIQGNSQKNKIVPSFIKYRKGNMF